MSAATPVMEAPAVPPSPLLGAKLIRLRRKLVSVAVLTGLAVLVIAGIELLALLLFLDWWLELPWGLRLLLLLAQCALWAWMLVSLIARPVFQQPGDDALALLVEKARPDFRTRLIASTQLTRAGAIPPGASAAMVEALVEQTEAAAAPLDFGALVPVDKSKKLGALAVAILLLAALGLAYGRSTALDLLKRAFLSHTPVPRKTRVFVIDPNKVIGRGDGVRVEASVQGVIPATGKVVLKARSRREQELGLEQDRENRARFGRTIENVQDSFSYQVRLNDGVSPWYRVETIPRPTVATLNCEQAFPAYTGLPPRRRSLGDLSLLAGSRLRLAVTATKPLQSAFIKCSGIDRSVPLQISAANPRQLTGELAIPAQALNGFSIQMQDTDRMESRDSAVYRVEIIPDKPPVVRITYPDRKEELITRQATMIIGMEIVDDFAITAARLRYRVDTLDQAAEKVLELDLQNERPQRLRRRHEWKIGAFNPLLPVGSRIEYWIEAQDNNDATGPGIGASEHQFAKVVSEEEKRADLLNRAGDYLGSINDVAGDQAKLNRNLGAIIREKGILK